MSDFDVYYKAKDSTGGKFSGSILHVCPAGRKVGSGMVPPRVLKITVTCEEVDIATFWAPNYEERDPVADAAMAEKPPDEQKPVAPLVRLKSRWLVDVAKHKNGEKVTLKDLVTIDRLPAALATVALSIKVEG